MRVLVLLMLMLMTASLIADPVVVLLDDDEPGAWLVVVREDGKTVAVRTKIVRPTGETDPNPEDPPGEELPARAKAIRDAALRATDDKNRDRTAGELSILYDELARRVEAGDIKGQETIAFISKQAADVVIAKGGTPAAWKPMRDVFAAQWVKLAQEGGKDADFAVLLRECADGLSASVTKPQALDFKQILEAIKVIIDLLLKLFPSGTAVPGPAVK